MILRKTFSLLLLLLSLSAAASALNPQKFEPLKDTLSRYGIVKLPEPSDYPDVPAIAVLSETEYKQVGTTHVRRFHRVIKILTSAGKEYTSLRIPCYAECRIDGRTIKADGKILNLPAKDLVRNEKMTAYSSPFTIAQFAMPGVEAGDIIEYTATLIIPVSFFMDDFRFAEPYPTLKGVFILTHPDDYSYTYVRFAPGGANQIQVRTEKIMDAGIPSVRTVFEMADIRGVPQEAFAPSLKQGQPGVRIVMDGRLGTRFEAFKDWFSYGKFISDMAKVPALASAPIQTFIKESIGTNKDQATVARAIYMAADKKIRIVEETLTQAGFDFADPDKVLEKKTGAPHDFALFVASCLKSQRISSELILVNSHDQPEAVKDTAFPLDLDLVFLNVKTDSGEFLLDCNHNGIPPGMLSSGAMNRFALGIPISTTATTMTVAAYVSTMPFHEGNKDHIDISATPAGDSWNIDFRWFLGGEFQTSFLMTYRQLGDAELLKRIAFRVRSRLQADRVQNLQYQWTTTGLEIKGQGSLRKNQVAQGIESLQNNFWDTGFSLRQYLFEGRKNSLLLPVSGEISSTMNFHLSPGMNAAIPASFQLDCSPAQYFLAFQKKDRDVTVAEKLLIQDMLVRPAAFPKWISFLDQYYAVHYWTLLMSGTFPATPAPAMQRVSFIPLSSASPAPAAMAPSVAKNSQATPSAQGDIAGGCKDASRVKITGKKEVGKLGFDLKNMTKQPIEKCEFQVIYRSQNSGESKKSYTADASSLPIPADTSRRFSYDTDGDYDLAKVYIRFQQNNVWHECGPFWIPGEMSE